MEKNSILDHSHVNDYNRKSYKSSYTLDFKRGILKVQEKSYKTKKKPRRLCFKLLIHSCFNLAMYSFVPIHHMQNVNIVKLTIKKIHLSFTKNKIQPALGSHLTILLSNKHCHCCRQPDLEWEYRRGSFSYYSTLLSLFFFFLFFIHGWKLLGALGRAPLGNALRTHGSAPGHVLISTWWEVWTKIKILWRIYRINKISFN